MITKDQLIADSCVYNRYMWIGSGWLYCKGCETYTMHEPYSHKGDSDCYEVCMKCNNYCGDKGLRYGNHR